MAPRKRTRKGPLVRLLAGLDAKTIGLLVALAGAGGNCVGGQKADANGTQRQDGTLAWVQALEDRMTVIEADRDSLRWRVKKLETRLARLTGKPVLGGAVGPYGPPAPKGGIAASAGRAAAAPFRWLGRLFTVKAG